MRNDWARSAAALRAAAALNPHEFTLLALAQVAIKMGRPLDALRTQCGRLRASPWVAQPMLDFAFLLMRLDPSGDFQAADAARRSQMLADADSAHASIGVESEGGGAPNACDLFRAANTLQPGLSRLKTNQMEALRTLCTPRKAMDGAPTIPVEALKALEGGPCAMLTSFPELAVHATPHENDGGDSRRCTVKLPAAAVRVQHRHADAETPLSNGVVVPSGVTLDVIGADGGGKGQAQATLDAGGASRHFLVASGGTLTLRDVTLEGGRALLSGGGSVLLMPGARLSASGVSFTGNRAVLGSGGAIASRGAAEVKLFSTRFERNEATWRGGALSFAADICLRRGGSDASAGTPPCESKSVLTGTDPSSAGPSGWVEFFSNRAGRGGGDASVSGAMAHVVASFPAGADVVVSGPGPDTTTPSKPTGSETDDAALRFPEAAILSLECISEALELLEVRAMEREAEALMRAAGRADPYSPNAFNFHFNFLYTHGFDADAALRLEAFESVVPDHQSIAQLKQVLGNESAVVLRQRGQTINGQVARMREGASVVVTYESRARAQDAATEAFLQALAIAPADGDTWNDLGTAFFYAGELSDALETYKMGAKLDKMHPALRKESWKARAFPAAPDSGMRSPPHSVRGWTPSSRRSNCRRARTAAKSRRRTSRRARRSSAHGQGVRLACSPHPGRGLHVPDRDGGDVGEEQWRLDDGAALLGRHDGCAPRRSPGRAAKVQRRPPCVSPARTLRRVSGGRAGRHAAARPRLLPCQVQLERAALPAAALRPGPPPRSRLPQRPLRVRGRRHLLPRPRPEPGRPRRGARRPLPQ